jgi:hypothetical protein
MKALAFTAFSFWIGFFGTLPGARMAGFLEFPALFS